MIARYLNDLKKARNMSWSEIANLSSVPQQTVRNIFSGETQNPSFMAVASIVTAMGGSLDEMMEIPRELPPPFLRAVRAPDPAAHREQRAPGLRAQPEF